MKVRQVASIVTVQQELDQGFRACLEVVKKMHTIIKEHFATNLEQLSGHEEELRDLILPWINPLYKTMARTMFKVLALMQPESFASGDVNFYFLPGYHSCLIPRRLFYSEQVLVEGVPTLQNFGVGFSGDPLKSPQVPPYHDCCQARWYTFATTRQKGAEFRPGSPYIWFAYQQPTCSDDIYDLIASFTISTATQTHDADKFPEHAVLQLDQDHSIDWGAQVAKLLNDTPHKSYPQWVFPDRFDRSNEPGYDEEREVRLRRARHLLISLWMHSVFETQRPTWWPVLMEELEKNNLSNVIQALTNAEVDPVASNWGDKGYKRPQFNTWTTLSMHRLAAPPPVPLVNPIETSTNDFLDPETYLQTVGWATMLSSVPLGLPFISVVRPWIRMVYGMLRSAEVNVLLQDRLPLHRAAQAARFISHDMHKFMQETVATVIDDIRETLPKTVEYRRFILLLLKAQAEFAYAVSHAATDSSKVQLLRSEIIKSLQCEDDKLVGYLLQVATEVQEFRGYKNAGHVIPLLPKQDFVEIPVETHTTCLLLIGEVIRNHRQHGKGAEGKLFITLQDKCLIIMLEVKRKCKVGKSFGLLDNTLTTLGLGSAKFFKADGESRWVITVDISEQEDSQ